MIRHLTGSVVEKGVGHLVLDISGVGYLVFAQEETLKNAKEDTEISLWVHLSVRETALELYGFTSKEDLAFFEMLIGVSGVGPKSALSILNLAPAHHLASAIASGDDAYLTKVSGIGRRSAAKIVVELKEKLQNAATENGDVSTQGASDTILALEALGYSTSEAREALREVSDETLDTNQKVKEALKYLSRT